MRRGVSLPVGSPWTGRRCRCPNRTSCCSMCSTAQVVDRKSFAHSGRMRMTCLSQRVSRLAATGRLKELQRAQIVLRGTCPEPAVLEAASAASLENLENLENDREPGGSLTGASLRVSNNFMLRPVRTGFEIWSSVSSQPSCPVAGTGIDPDVLCLGEEPGSTDGPGQRICRQVNMRYAPSAGSTTSDCWSRFQEIPNSVPMSVPIIAPNRVPNSEPGKIHPSPM